MNYHLSQIFVCQLLIKSQYSVFENQNCLMKREIVILDLINICSHLCWLMTVIMSDCLIREGSVHLRKTAVVIDDNHNHLFLSQQQRTQVHLVVSVLKPFSPNFFFCTENPAFPKILPVHFFVNTGDFSSSTHAVSFVNNHLNLSLFCSV